MTAAFSNRMISIEALACATSASARSLFHQFKRSRGQSPIAFVKDVRLRRASRNAPTDGRHSFGNGNSTCLRVLNLGHFAHDYFKRFGERPSETLRRRCSKTMTPASPLPVCIRCGATRRGRCRRTNIAT